MSKIIQIVLRLCSIMYPLFRSGVRLERQKVDRFERRKVDRLERRKVTRTDT